MNDMTMQELLKAGVHFGHQTQKWNPRMKPYIFGKRRGIHIINLEKTLPMFEEALAFITETVASGGQVLFVGTKRQARAVIEDEAKRCGMFYVKNRWLGGTLTNFKTIKASIDRLIEFEKNLEEGMYDSLKKKERRVIERAVEKLEKALGGIKGMEAPPAVMFIIDPHKENIAQREANRLGIPVVAVTDTNCDPEGIDYLIPGNDDAIKAIRIFAAQIADACLLGTEQRQERIRMDVKKEAEQEEVQEEVSEKAKEFVPEKTRSFVSRAVKAESVTIDANAAKQVVAAKPEAPVVEKAPEESKDGAKND